MNSKWTSCRLQSQVPRVPPPSPRIPESVDLYALNQHSYRRDMGDGPSFTPPTSPLSPITAVRQASAKLRRPRSRGGARSARAQAATARILVQNHRATAACNSGMQQQHATATVTRGGRRRRAAPTATAAAASTSASDTESDDWHDANEERRWGCCCSSTTLNLRFCKLGLVFHTCCHECRASGSDTSISDSDPEDHRPKTRRRKQPLTYHSLLRGHLTLAGDGHTMAAYRWCNCLAAHLLAVPHSC